MDKGVKGIPFFDGETVTEGLDGLDERLDEYYELGADSQNGEPLLASQMICLKKLHQTECHALARYAALCQQAQIVPIVEPEVLMDGTHDIDRCFDVTSEVLQEVFAELNNQQVALNGIVSSQTGLFQGWMLPIEQIFPLWQVQP
ncbi:MAG: hypothetical protein Ct9H90mP13_01600 [Pseudomonadota bacterium]|nr:MAG: hypothetical protein Ct9H90mP13_01600 [Pseudomonadota bacterium]